MEFNYLINTYSIFGLVSAVLLFIGYLFVKKKV